MSNSWFDLFFNAFGAYQQICCLAGSLLCLALGGFILGNSLYWRLHAERVNGTIAGLRNKGGFYHPVYRYTLSNGQSFEANSDSGSSSPLNNETGKAVSLLVFHDKPTEARLANTYVFEIIGLGFAVPGVLFLHMALTAWPVTKMTFVMLAALGLYAAIKLHHLILPADKRMPVSQAKADMLEKNRTEMQAIPIQRMEDIAGSAPAQQANSQRQLGLFFIAFGPLLLCLSFYTGWQMLALAQNGVRSPGIVTSLQTEWSNNKTTYHPIVSFTSHDGSPFHFKDKTGSNPPMYRAGDSVTVLYLEAKPDKSAIIDRGLWNWIVPVVLFLIGSLILVFTPRLLWKPPASKA